jgi:hypothetical protein
MGQFITIVKRIQPKQYTPEAALREGKLELRRHDHKIVAEGILEGRTARWPLGDAEAEGLPHPS